MATMNFNRMRDVDVVIDKANDNFIQKQWVSVGDKDGRTLTVMVTDAGIVGEVPGVTLSLYWKNLANGITDEHAFVVKDKATSKFILEFPDNMLTQGKVIAQIRIWFDGKVVATKTFEIEVGGIAGVMSGVVKQQEFGLLTAVLADANKFRSDIDNLGDSKVDKDGAGQVTWGMISQNAREQIIGNMPPAVVGRDAVGTDNIINRSITKVDIKKNELTQEEIAHNVLNVIVAESGAVPDYNPDTGIFDFLATESNQMTFSIGNKRITVPVGTKLTTIDILSTSCKLILDTQTNDLFFKAWNFDLTATQVAIGTMRKDGSRHNLPFTITVKGKSLMTRLTDILDNRLKNIDFSNTSGYMHLSVDDVIGIFKDIKDNQYTSIFNHPTLAFFKQLHDEFGAVFSLYCFYKNDSESFNLSMMPSQYATEFKANASWLKFGVHYYKDGSNFANSNVEQSVNYYKMIINELYRICGGPQALDFMPRLQNYSASADFVSQVSQINLGIKGLITSEDSRQNYHLSPKQNAYMQLHDSLYDADNFLKLVSTDLRLENVSDVKATLNSRLTNADFASRSGSLLLFTHEPFLSQPAMQIKMRDACEFARDNNYHFDYPINH